MRARRRGFTLIELLVAMALSALLIGVLAVTFQEVTRAYEASLSRVEAARLIQLALERIDADWQRAVAIPVAGPPHFFQVQRDPAAPPREGGGGPLLHDELHLLVLEDRGGEAAGPPTPPRLVRVRWHVAWDAEREVGTLRREVRAVEIPGVPLATLLPAEEQDEPVLGRLLEARFQPFLEESPEGYAVPPAPEGVDGFCGLFLRRGDDARIEGFELVASGQRFDPLQPGDLIHLEDGAAQPRIDAGFYTIARRGPPGRLVLATPPGNVAGGVRYRAAWLPAALLTAVEVRDGRTTRRQGRILLRRGRPVSLLRTGAGE